MSDSRKDRKFKAYKSIYFRSPPRVNPIFIFESMKMSSLRRSHACIGSNFQKTVGHCPSLIAAPPIVPLIVPLIALAPRCCSPRPLPRNKHPTRQSRPCKALAARRLILVQPVFQLLHHAAPVGRAARVAGWVAGKVFVEKLLCGFYMFSTFSAALKRDSVI